MFPLSDVLPSLAPVPAAGCPLSAVFPAYGVLPVPSAPVSAFPLGGGARPVCAVLPAAGCPVGVARPAYGVFPAAGVSWYADLKGYIGVQPTKLYGSGTFKLAPKSTTTSGSTTLYGHYVHPKAELGLSVNVSSYGSFSISGGSNYDERGSQKTISW